MGDARLALEIHENVAPPGWDDALRSAGGVVFHSEAWAAYKVHESGGEPQFCLWRDVPGGEVVGRGLAIRKPPRGSLLGRVASKLVFDSPPASSAPGLDFVAPLRTWADSNRGVIEVTLGSFDPLGDWSPREVPHPHARWEFPLPPGDADGVWGEMRQLARRKVKRAQQDDLDCRLANGPNELRAFAEVVRETVKRLQRDKSGVPGFVPDRDHFADSLSLLAERGQVRVYAAYRDDRLEAGTAFATFGDRAYLIYSAATDPGREAGGPFLVLFEALQDLRASGHAHINLGGASGDAADPDSPEHGLHQFKTRFGADVELCTSGSLTPRPLRARVVEGGRRLVRR